MAECTASQVAMYLKCITFKKIFTRDAIHNALLAVKILSICLSDHSSNTFFRSMSSSVMKFYLVEYDKRIVTS